MAWEQESSNQSDPRRYRYEPTWEKEFERHPDKLASVKRLFEIETSEPGRVITLLEVTGEGVVVMRERVNVLTNEIEPLTCAIFTWDQIQFD